MSTEAGQPGDVAEKQVDVAAPPRPRKRRRWLSAAVVAGVCLLGVGYYYAFNNWAWHGDAWVSGQIDGAIERGLAYLHASGSFAQPYDEGGEHRTHHWFLDQVLRREEHAGLRQQMRDADDENRRRRNWTWRAFGGMPGWPDPQISHTEWRLLQHNLDTTPDNPNTTWLLFGLYPEQLELPEEDRRLLFETPERIDDGYELTHALLAYVWLQQRAPQLAAELHVGERIADAGNRMRRQQTWDARPSDIYNERVAFWLLMRTPDRIRPRWVERILLSQNADGGWTFNPSETRMLRQMVGLRGNGASHPHPTFLALYALVEYRELLREREAYPP